MEDIGTLTTVLARAETELRRFEERGKTLERECDQIVRKTEAAAGDAETLAQLKIETEQVAEAKRENDRLIAEATKRIEEFEYTIEMQRQSDMT
jgi:hypothetical protein